MTSLDNNVIPIFEKNPIEYFSYSVTEHARNPNILMTTPPDVSCVIKTNSFNNNITLEMTRHAANLKYLTECNQTLIVVVDSERSVIKLS